MGENPGRSGVTSRRVRTSVSWLALAALSCFPSASAADHSPAAARGVASLDVYAQGDVVDLLVVEKSGHGAAVRHQRSRDGGATWGAASDVPVAAAGLASPTRGSDAQVAARGDLVVVLYETKGASKWGGGPLATALSADGGRTWRLGPNPADDNSSEGHSFMDLAVDSQGAFHAVWLDSRDGGQGLRGTRSKDGGQSWERNQTIDERTCECCWNTLLPSKGGEMLALYRDKDPRDMALARAEPGQAWKRVGTVGSFDWAFEGCPHVGGGVARSGQADGPLHAVVWTGREDKLGVYWTASNDSGRTWSEPKLLDAKGRHCDLAANGSALAVAWDGARDGAPPIRVAVSADGGGAWKATRRLGSPSASASHPRVLATKAGFLVVWTEAAGAAGAAWRSAILSSPGR
jgi:hypothetical protein